MKISLDADDAINLAKMLSRIDNRPRFFAGHQEKIDQFCNDMENVDRMNKEISERRIGMTIGVTAQYVQIDEETALAIALLLEYNPG